MYTNDGNPSRSPMLMADPAAWTKMQILVQECPVEVNGFAYLTRIGPRELYLASPADVFITPQTATVGSAHVTSDTMALAQDRAHRDGRGGELRLQFHGHPGAAYFSATDMDTVDSYGFGGAQWMVSVVFDRQGGHVMRLDTYAPVRTSVELPLRFVITGDTDLRAACRAELERNVTKLVPVKGRNGAITRMDPVNVFA